MKKSLTLIALLALTAFTSLHARLGENEDQIKARYGNALRDIPLVGFKKCLYKFVDADMMVIVCFKDGLSVNELYWKLNGQQFSSQEIQILREKNAPNQQ